MRYRLSLFTTLLTFFALILGNLVTATGAQDACGSDWPLCEGKYYPDLTDPLQVIEYTHRLATSGLGFVILINAIVAWRGTKGKPGIRPFAVASIFLLILQALTGGFNVLLNTPPGFTTLDVAFSLALLVSLVCLTVAIKADHLQQIHNGFALKMKSGQIYKPALYTVLSFYLNIIIGAFFKHSAASEVMMNKPIEEQLITSMQASEFIYFTHGILAMIVLIGGFRVLFQALRDENFIRPAMVLCFLIICEIMIGFTTVITELAVLSSSLHMLFASASIAVGAYLIAKAKFWEVYSKLG